MTTAIRWRDIEGYEGFYQVSDTGMVRSLDRVVPDTRPHGGFRRLRGRLVAPGRAPSGHLRVRLGRDGRKQMYGVHQLVLRAFVGPPPPGLICCHNDGDPQNNRVDNLRWDTYVSNGLDAVRHGNNPYALRTKCPKGHPYDEINTYYTPRGKRDCRTCRRDAGKRARLRRQVRAA